eukprot:CAMPEP_0179454260 /NCGR_PEP_ID=MMETSP0799-20121207/38122_1 /TAXON_ID=46947 /ORGANISM="Geminigera cryophila, Strain CCMP2564" /LENGTH=60 /DNA_ID=CAMNT_0021251957 /DNA_START=218 /DNA_END=400 /DNA_ORIENTATION=+
MTCTPSRPLSRVCAASHYHERPFLLSNTRTNKRQDKTSHELHSFLIVKMGASNPNEAFSC